MMTGLRPAAPRWTQRDENELFELLKAGKTAVEISRKLRRTPGAIYSRLQRLYRRQTPWIRGRSLAASPSVAVRSKEIVEAPERNGVLSNGFSPDSPGCLRFANQAIVRQGHEL
jgi:hypothetical protein